MIDDKWFTVAAVKETGKSGRDDYGIRLMIELFNLKLTIQDLTRDQFLFALKYRGSFPGNVYSIMMAILNGDMLLRCDENNEDS